MCIIRGTKPHHVNLKRQQNKHTHTQAIWNGEKQQIFRVIILGHNCIMLPKKSVATEVCTKCNIEKYNTLIAKRYTAHEYYTMLVCKIKTTTDTRRVHLRFSIKKTCLEFGQHKWGRCYFALNDVALHFFQFDRFEIVMLIGEYFFWALPKGAK